MQEQQPMASLIPSNKLIALVKAADPSGQMLVNILDGHRLGVGLNPWQPTAILDLSTETVVRGTPQSASEAAKSDENNSSSVNHNGHAMRRTGRVTGRYWYELDGKRVVCGSIKELLLNGLESIEGKRAGTLHKLSNIKKRTKRIVARNPNDLFDQKHLVTDHSEKLSNGWWVGTNNSSDETKGWLRQAVAHAGLAWGKDFQISI